MDPDQAASDPNWDAERAAWLVGRYALVGMTWVEADGTTVKRTAQYHGTIVSCTPAEGVTIVCAGAHVGESICLPPAPNRFEDAKPGEYRLRTTGEVVKDPDVTSSWTIQAPPN